jgi:hypothetical protein
VIILEPSSNFPGLPAFDAANTIPAYENSHGIALSRAFAWPFVSFCPFVPQEIRKHYESHALEAHHAGEQSRREVELKATT